MFLRNPEGLWLLTFIPLLIILRLIRAKFEPQMISSTYLWKRSEKNRKKHINTSRFRKLIQMLLQISLFVLAALIASGLSYVGQKNSAEMVAIVDTSASMRMQTAEGETLFARAQKQLLDDAPSGARVSVLTTDLNDYYRVDRSDSPVEISTAVKEIACGWGVAAPEKALAAAQEILRLNPDAHVYYYTDHEIRHAENIEVVNIAPENLVNTAVTGMDCMVSAGGFRAKSTVISYGGDNELAAGLYLDDVLVSAQLVSCTKDVETEINWYVPETSAFSSARVVLDITDALEEDNSFAVYAQNYQRARIAIVSDHPFYWQHAFDAIGGYDYTVFGKAWEMPVKGYDIYLFDGCLPERLPADGAVWLICPPENAVVFSGLKTEETVRGGILVRTNERLADERQADVLKDLANRNTAVKRLTRITASTAWKTLLYAGKYPALIAGYIDGELPALVVTFDLHDSNLPLQTDYLVLVRNMVKYSVPPMLTASAFEAEETINISRLPLCRQADVTAPDGECTELQPGGNDYFYIAAQPGLYTVQQMRENGDGKKQSFLVTVPREESSIAADGRTVLYLSRNGEANAPKSKGISLVLPLSLLLLVMLALESVVYNRERI